ncbi:hypothetical protein ACFOON_01165 [Novosphingobium piscinae]|uniref:Uncharacterized protein n=1 Tax=Novosphingobium piscinae TaxID=1507448 RepID=A0A7X1FVM4_9SPHN|nr:hypothetical protein [Novosphingobium piscinae]MBC2667810.1 hypothetical protein [Novosphingobium piscinae]
MSRAMNIALPEQKVRDMCQRGGVTISAIETLPDGGTHLVCLTSEGAEEMRTKLGNHLIAHRVKRFAFYRA